MKHTRHQVIRVSWVFLMITLAASVIAGCGNATTHLTVTPTPTLPIPNDPAPVTVVADQATTLNLGGGAHLIIPPGAMTPGATVSATYKGRPDGNWITIAPTFAPVELISNPPDAIHGLLTLEFPVAVDQITSGVDPAVQFGISTYDPATKTWTPFASTYDPARHMIVALIPHFSWWNPFTWDFSALFANIAQGFGQLVGERAAPPKCSGGAPSWVGSLAGVLQDADVAIRSCAQSKGDILDIQIVNNRPYGQVLTYGSGVSWGWHESGSGVIEPQLIRLMDHFMGHNQLYLPPLGAASVGIFKPAAGSNSIFYIGPTVTTIAMDLAFFAAGKIDKVIKFAVDHIVGFGGCAALYANVRLSGVSTSALRDDLEMGLDCLAFGFTYLVSKGVITADMLGRFAATGAAIRAAKVVGAAILIGDATWKIADLIADWKLVKPSSTLGNGFSVYAKSASTPPPPASYANKIVQWDGDTKAQKTSWLVAGDLRRYSIPNTSTYNCLRSSGFAFGGALSSTVLNQLPVKNGNSAACGTNALYANQRLFRGSYLRTSDGNYTLKLQLDGNLVLRGPTGAVVWANGKTSDYLVMQGDGNLVTYRFGGTSTWATNTSGTGATKLAVQNGGKLVLYSSTGAAIWDSIHGRL